MHNFAVHFLKDYMHCKHESIVLEWFVQSSKTVWMECWSGMLRTFDTTVYMGGGVGGSGYDGDLCFRADLLCCKVHTHSWYSTDDRD